MRIRRDAARRDGRNGMNVRAGRSIYLALVLVLPAFALAEEAPECGTSYTVQQGDTVAAIAQRCGSTMDALISANPDLKDPARISIGQELALPGAPDEAAPEEAAESSSTSATPDDGTEASATEGGEAEPSKAAPAGDTDLSSDEAKAVESEAKAAPAEEDRPADMGNEVSDEGGAEDPFAAGAVESTGEAGEASPAATSQPSDVVPAGETVGEPEVEPGEEASQDDTPQDGAAAEPV